MGLTHWEAAPNGRIVRSDVAVAKNYLSTEELDYLERIVSIHLDFAELQAIRKIPMSAPSPKRYGASETCRTGRSVWTASLSSTATRS